MRNHLAPEHVSKLFNTSPTQLKYTINMCTVAIILAVIAILCNYSCCNTGNINRSDTSSRKVYIPDAPVTKTPKDTIG